MRLLAFVFLSVIAGVRAEIIEVTPDFAGGIQPQVCVADGKVFVAFGKEKTVYIAKSGDAGKSFGRPEPVATLDKLALGMRRGPRVVAARGVIAISAISSEKGDLLVWTSSDDGATWSKETIVNDVSGSAREGLHAMAMNSEGKMFLTWLDLRNKGMELWGASYDKGGEAGKNIRIYSSPDGHICECCHPSAAYMTRGELVVMWRNWLGGARDMYWAISRDGSSFGPATKLGSGSWPLNACPMDGGAITSDSRGEPISIWRRQSTVYVSSSSNSECQISPRGKQPIIIAGNGKLYCLWVDGGKLMLQVEPGSRKAEVLAENAAFPSVTSPGLNASPIVVWESSVNDSKTILSQILR